MENKLDILQNKLAALRENRVIDDAEEGYLTKAYNRACNHKKATSTEDDIEAAYRLLMEYPPADVRETIYWCSPNAELQSDSWAYSVQVVGAAQKRFVAGNDKITNFAEGRAAYWHREEKKQKTLWQLGMADEHPESFKFDY